MDATVLLCDWAEAIQGKLYAQGIGWRRIKANTPGAIAVGILIGVPYDQTNSPHTAQVKLLTEDGQPWPTEQGAEFGFKFEVGRPPGMKKGEEQSVVFAAQLQGIQFDAGSYSFHLLIDEEPVTTAGFTAA